jgi:hypothetical protein
MHENIPTEWPAEGVVAAARSIIPHLDQFVGPASAELRPRIEGLLIAAERGDDVAGDLARLLSETPETAGFLTAVLNDAPQFRSPYQQERYVDGPTRQDLPLLSGDPAPVAAATYHCPECAWTWLRPSVGTPIPRCPNDDAVLVRR